MEGISEQSVDTMSLKKKLKIAYEIVMAGLALISVIFIWNENSLIRNLDFIIWLIFMFDVSIRFFTSKDKWGYVKKHPLDIVAIIPLDSIFRLARLGRLLRLLRLLAIIKHFMEPLHAIFRTNNLDKVILFLIIVIFVISIPIQLLEPSIETYADAVWWAVVTSTTVGYGDISPETVVGRLIAVVLMIFGIGLLGLVTSSVASYFIQKGQREDSTTVKYLKEQMERIEELSDEEIDRVKLLIESYKGRKRGTP